ncbi:PEP-CTERM sorting domain-containing protein [Alteromonadaceae bacterium BrNp21-10]|nr:PEP-CTERM sorting domain-containing protein [Alteromonadaceae bacterium BrNp21-10]
MKNLVKKLANTGGLILCLFMSAQSNAAIINLEVADSVGIGSSFDLIVSISDLSLDDLSVFDIDVAFDDTLLTFTNLSLVADPWGSFHDQFGLSGEEYLPGLVNILDVSDLLDFSGQADTFVLAILSFDAIAMGNASFSVAYQDLVDGNGLSLVATSDSTNLSVVPEPGSMAMFLFGLVALVSRYSPAKKNFITK